MAGGCRWDRPREGRFSRFGAREEGMVFGELLVVRFPVHAPAAAAVAGLLLLAVSSPLDALAATSSSSPSPSPGGGQSKPVPAGAEPAQEITLESAGVGSQVVQGASGSVEV